ncbi:protein MAK16 homolog [Malaya genurostris]|uniref:protein MAK16 homolog n=1 Tax=Malaya genurostris TaxID=325434 RepID=UPI0026F3D2CF|nr:protein MAK16 homolog [Malaya genurostris]
MVFCDHCQRWYHFGCAGVKDDVRNNSWSCPDCEACESDVADSSKLQKELEPLEEVKKKQKRKIEREMILHRKRLQMQQELLDMRQQLEREKRNMELEFEKAQLEKKIAEEEERQKNLNKMRSYMNEKLKLLKLKRTVESDVGELQSNKESAVGRVEKEGSKEKSQNRTIAEKAKAGKVELENKSREKESRNLLIRY